MWMPEVLRCVEKDGEIKYWNLFFKGEREEVEFAHPYFIRGQEHLLEQIKRKISVATRGPGQHSLPTADTEKVSILGKIDRIHFIFLI